MTNDIVPTYLKKYVTQLNNVPLNEDLCNQYFKLIIGEHYFDIFRKTGSDEYSTKRDIHSITLTSEQYTLLTDSKTLHYTSAKLLQTHFCIEWSET